MGEYQIIAMAAGMFFEFGIKDFIDILLVAFLLYYVYKLMKASGSLQMKGVPFRTVPMASSCLA